MFKSSMASARQTIGQQKTSSDYIEKVDQLQSSVISFLRFPLIVAVVLIHSRNMGGIPLVDSNDIDTYTYVNFLISEIIAKVAVPLFFFISGFLFFKGVFNAGSYKRKLKKRCSSLLIPYIFWNLAVVALFYLFQTFMPGMTSGRTKLIIDYNLYDWIRVFWDSYFGMPMCFQFWFIRDLMIIMLFSPLIYFAIKYSKGIFVIFVGLLWFFDIWLDLTGFSIAALFFFSAGAYFNIMKQSFLLKFKPFMKYALTLYPILCLICLILKESVFFQYILNLSIIAGMVSAITLTGHYISAGKWHVNRFLSESSFFIYAYHAVVLTLIMKLGVKVISNASSGTLIMVFFLYAFLTVTIGLAIYYLIKKYLPNFTNFITGSR